MRLLLVAAGLAALAAPGQAADTGPVSFHAEAGGAGIASTFDGEWEYMTGGGAAIFDCNDDGFPDLYLAGGSSPAHFYRNISVTGGAIRFDTPDSGLAFDAVLGAYPLDIDSDGKMDLLVLRQGENLAMRGLGDCRFERANETWGFEGGKAWSTALAATWEQGNSWPTIAVGNYINREEEISPWGSCTDNWLHRPAEGQKTFAPPLPLKPSFCPLSMLFTDWNRSGTPSLRVSNDREYYEGGQEQMWKVEPGKAPQLFTEAEGWKYLRIWGMGIASTDLDGDSYPDYFLTSMADNKLQVLDNVPAGGKPRPSYKDIAFKRGVTAHRPYTGGEWRPSTAWHTQFADVDNDALTDLFIAKGNVAEMPDFALRDPNNLFLQNPDGTFREVGDTAGVASFNIARGGGLADFNLDGRMDLVVVNRWVNAELWRNTTARAGNWVQFKLRQNGANRDGIGAWVEVTSGGRTQRQEITLGGGHASGQAGWIHFGIGEGREADVKVLWPGDGASDSYRIPANGFAVLERGQTAAQPWVPPR